MGKQEKWNEEADKFLAGPERKSKFSNINVSSESAVVVRKRGHYEHYGAERGLQAMLATLLLDFFCESLPASRRKMIKAELSATMINLSLIPPSFLSDDFASVRNVFTSLIYSMIGRTSSPNVDASLTSGNAFSVYPTRYQTDFDELEPIGEGGFGTVFKVKSRLDNCLYAVKKIKLKKQFNEISLKVLNEIHFLASLQHKNVVRYHSGWLEHVPCENPPSAPKSPTSPTSPMKITEILDNDSDAFGGKQLSEYTSEQIDFTDSDKEIDDVMSTSSSSESDSASTSSLSSPFSESSDSNSSPEDSFVAKPIKPVNTPSKLASGKFGKFWNDGDSTTTECDTDAGSVASSRKSPDNQIKKSNFFEAVASMGWKPVVFIQMELCEMTLEEYFVKRNKENNFLGTKYVDGVFNRELEVQLLSALEYIHHKHLIHRDIKPSNIFLKHDNKGVRILVGDFGLACVDLTNADEDTIVLTEQRIVRRRRRRSSSLQIHSMGVGTTTYAAPEQLRCSDYGPMVDIYSAGIVLFEAYSMFGTSMEKVRGIEQLRTRRQVDEAMIERWPTVASMILKMTHSDPHQRPTASQLLRQYNMVEDSLVTSLREIIKEQELEIQRLRKEVAVMKMGRRRQTFD